jgi:hypothetical protein
MGTSLERIAPESQTPAATGFVHGNMSLTLLKETQDRVSGGLIPP